MKLHTYLAFLSVVFLASVSADVKDKNIVRARLESCPGCKLNRLTEVKAFAYDDIPKYGNTEFKKIHGAPPVLLFLNNADEVVEKHPLEHMNREECNNLLQSRGFTQKSNKEL